MTEAGLNWHGLLLLLISHNVGRKCYENRGILSLYARQCWCQYERMSGFIQMKGKDQSSEQTASMIRPSEWSINVPKYVSSNTMPFYSDRFSLFVGFLPFFWGPFRVSQSS